jgi:hypothetical protein
VRGLPHFQGGGVAKRVAQKVGGVFSKINEKIFIGLWANHYNRIGKRKKFLKPREIQKCRNKLRMLTF